MYDHYVKALHGELYSPESAAAQAIQFYNRLPVPIVIYYLNTTGRRQRIGLINPRQNAGLNAIVGAHYVATLNFGGIFVCSFEIADQVKSYTVDFDMVAEPNDIGPIPKPSEDVMVPQNSPSVLIALGQVPGQSNWVVRHQYWALGGDSYSLAPKEKRTNSFTVVAGRQSTSSTQAEIGTAVSVSGTAGWGAISGSVSAAVNASASMFQQVTISEQSTSYVSEELTGDDDDSTLILRWQLMDCLDVYNDDSRPVATVSSASIVIVKAYKVSDIKAKPERPRPVRRDAASALGLDAPPLDDTERPQEIAV